MAENNASIKIARWLKNIISLAIFFCFLGHAADINDVQFNSDILDVKDKKNIDLSRFSKAGYIMPGNYTVTLHVNNNNIPEQSVNWFTADNDDIESKPCFPADVLKIIGLKPELTSQLTWWHKDQCLNTESLPGINVRGNPASGVLYLNIPQIYLEYRAPGWDLPSQWDDGIPGGLVDYYASAQSRHNTSGISTNTLSGNGVVGANVGPWRLRGDWQGRYNSNTSQRAAWDWTRFYTYRAVKSIKARLSLGQNSLYSDVFDTFNYTGLSLQSDDNMLPPNLGGYAPEVSGIARTNAKVIISQQGRVIQETQVAAGPFRIQDLNEVITGKLDVKIEEQDGSVQTFTLNTASVPFLTRPGTVRYKLATGKPSDVQRRMEGPEFVTGELSWGAGRGWSLYGGMIGSENYNALSSGVGRDLMALGALSFDVTQSLVRRLPGDKTQSQSGASYRVSYAKHFDETDSEMTLAGYRYSDQGYMSMGEYLTAQKYGVDYGNNKEMYTLSFSQQLRDWRMSLYLNYSHQTYWDKQDNDRFTLTASQYFNLGKLRNLSLSASAFNNKNNNINDKGIYLLLSMPWDSNGTLSYNSNFGSHNNSQQVSYYATVDDHNNYQLSSGITRRGTMASGYFNHRADIAQINANTSYQAGRYSSIGVSVQGGGTATAQGAALHRTSMQGGSRMLIDTAGIAGVPIKTFGANTRTNRFGKAVVADVSSYYRNRISIDVNLLPDDAEAISSVVQRTLTEGAIGFGRFDVVSGSKAMAVLTLDNGEAVPFGATVQNTQRQDVGMVGDDGTVYLRGIRAGSKMNVFWGGEERCEITLPGKISTDFTQYLLLPCRLPPSAQ
ncbi:outer membrane usher protein [Erwinia mallotivora]|uniref:outer membrane usher protein n=1 Tax=Erwinia mallotivora TaxID=69222 RepID=UPI0021C14700|nr:outer membrane usher protein [Erwinia mallotivora]